MCRCPAICGRHMECARYFAGKVNAGPFANCLAARCETLLFTCSSSSLHCGGIACRHRSSATTKASDAVGESRHFTKSSRLVHQCLKRDSYRPVRNLQPALDSSAGECRPLAMIKRTAQVRSQQRRNREVMKGIVKVWGVRAECLTEPRSSAQPSSFS